MTGVVVVGAQWGDEGKGKIVDWLSSRADVIVRFQGGHNAGHTLVIDGKVFKLNLLPSGVVRGGKLSIIGNGVVVDPWHLLAEIESIGKSGVHLGPDDLILADNAVLILPWHKDIDAAREEAAAGAQIGTTRRGIGPAYEDKVGRRAIRVADLADPAALDLKLDRLLAHHRPLRLGLNLPEPDGAQLKKDLLAIAPQILAYAQPAWERLDQAVRLGRRILFEGAQGVMLDVDHGTYPFVTSSNPTAGGACTGTGIGPRQLDRIVGITKAYTTRVGSGPFPTELLDNDGERLVDIGREFGTVTGRRRRTGWIDCVMLRQAVRINSLTELALTKLDVLDTFDTVKVCVGYRVNGELLASYPDRVELLAQVEPEYIELPGWNEVLGAARRPEDLPEAARAFVRLVEAQVGVPISVVGVGAERDDYLMWA
jgi:adenylosuccinate synthase